MKHILLVAIVATLALACEPKEANNVQGEQFIEGVVVSGGALYFESSKEFNSLVDNIVDMSDDTFRERVQATGFNSYRVKVEDEQANYDTKLQSVLDSIKQHIPTGVIKAPEMADIIDSLNMNGLEKPTPTITDPRVASIVNTEGEYYVEGEKKVVNTGDKVVAADSTRTK